MHTLNIDLETYSSVDLFSAGLYKYAQSLDFEILLFGFSFDNAPVQVVDMACGEQIPSWLISALYDANVTKIAFNAPFEWYCLSRWLWLHDGEQSMSFDEYGLLPIDQWRDTMLSALYCGYPGSLKDVGAAIGLPTDKKKLASGKSLIKLFSCPTTPNKRNGMRTRTYPAHEPDKWNLYKQYNAQDVVTEMAVANYLAPWPVPDFVQKEWELDILQNERGVKIDTDLLHGALYIADLAYAEHMEEAKALTGLDNPNSDAQLIKWLNEQGVSCTSVAKEPLQELLNTTLTDNTRRVLELRKELGKTSTKKYDAMALCIGEGERVRGVMQFYGANRTGREAGRLIQVQNLPRTHLAGLDFAREIVKGKKSDILGVCYGSLPDTLSQLIRTALIPAKGCRFVDADFSAIEARVLAWMAGEEWVLEVFRTHGKIYETTASQMFGVPLDKIVKGSPEYSLRQQGKVAVLALGYQGGANAIETMDFDHVIPAEDRAGIVKKWRTANPRIVDFWYQVDAAMADTVSTGRTNIVGAFVFAYEADTRGQAFMTVRLPSGRKLFYVRPSITTNRFGSPSVAYWGQNQTTKQWCQIETYGGKLTENLTQAVARDLLMFAIKNLEAAGHKIVFHVHDEVIVEEPIDKIDLEGVYEIMSIVPDWAQGLPLGADGWVGDYYKKD